MLKLFIKPTLAKVRRAFRKAGREASEAAQLEYAEELIAAGVPILLERLMRSGLRYCESFAVIDAHAAGEIQPVAIRRIGPDLVFARLWKESGIPEVLRSLLRARDYEFDVERAIYRTVLHRLFSSGSDRAAERWREDYLIPGTEGLELHHLYQGPSPASV